MNQALVALVGARGAICAAHIPAKIHRAWCHECEQLRCNPLGEENFSHLSVECVESNPACKAGTWGIVLLAGFDGNGWRLIALYPAKMTGRRRWPDIIHDLVVRGLHIPAHIEFGAGTAGLRNAFEDYRALH